MIHRAGYLEVDRVLGDEPDVVKVAAERVAVGGLSHPEAKVFQRTALHCVSRLQVALPFTLTARAVGEGDVVAAQVTCELSTVFDSLSFTAAVAREMRAGIVGETRLVLLDHGMCDLNLRFAASSMIVIDEITLGIGAIHAREIHPPDVSINAHDAHLSAV